MERDLCKFYDNIEIYNKDYTKYADEKGNMFIFNTVYALLKVDYLEVSTEKKYKLSEYNKLLFEKKIEDLDYNEVIKKTVVPKSDITGKEEDFTTIVDKNEKAAAIWRVSNNLGIIKCYTTKEEAIKFANEINENILKFIK